MIIKQIDSIWLKADNPDLIKKCLTYEKAYWTNKGLYGKQRKKQQKSLLQSNGHFLAGFEKRVRDYYCKRYGKDALHINYIIPYDDSHIKPSLPGLTFKDEQSRLIQQALIHQKGVLIAPTGFGKTVIALGIMSSFPKHKILFLCHTISLLMQTVDELKRFAFNDIGIIDANNKDLNGRIIVSTIQSFSHIDPMSYADLFDVVIVDEAHHIGNDESQYYKVLTHLLAHVRIGLTATLPRADEEKMLYIEGLLGPMLDQVTLEEGIKKEILAIPKVKIVPMYKPDSIINLTKYRDIYPMAIEVNRIRNKRIIEQCREQNDIGKSCLVYVKTISHGEKLLEMGKVLLNDVVFIQGATEGFDRNQLRKDLQDKKIMNVIATTVWKEGINIPSLNTIILAAGGKSELQLLQTIGRGIRRDKGKEEMLIIDFADTGKFVSEHFVERLKIYLENKWELVY